MQTKIKEEKLYITLIRVLGTILLFLAYYHEYQNQALVSYLSGLFILLMYMVLIWAPVSWWNEFKYYVVVFSIIAVILIFHYIFDSPAAGMLWPLFFMIIFMTQVYPRVSIITAISTLFALSLLYEFSLSTILGLLGIIFVARSIKIRRDAHRLTVRHLEELDQAHKELEMAHTELQEASIHSIRYAALEERTRLARDIHDGIGHELTSLIFQLEALEIMQKAEPEKASESIRQLIGIARKAMAEVRVAVKEWSNDEMGLGIIAIKSLINQTQSRSSITFHFNQNSEVSDWPIETSVVVYRVLQEALTNILRHSNAELTWIDIEETDGLIKLTVTDNGITMRDGTLKVGYGLNGILSRCKEWGGKGSFAILEPHGFQVEAQIPLERLEHKKEGGE